MVEYVCQEAEKQGLTKEAICALLAQLQEESGFNPQNLEDKANRKLGMSDQEYTRAVDNGTYTNFVNDGFGYGLFQVTYFSRKRMFLDWVRARGGSIGSTELQVSYMWWEFANYFASIWKMMKTSNDMYALTWKLLDVWENPDEKTNNMKRRYGYAQEWYAKVRMGGASAEREVKMSKVDTYVQEAIAIANDNSHGYSQADRWGPNYDCSSLVITVVQNAGIPVRTNGASYTGNMRSAFLRCGFKDVTASCNLATGAGMQWGDILLNDSSHAAIFIGSGKVVHARTDEGNAQSGDQSGNEIRTQGYWNYPWNVILRYGGESTYSGSAATAAAAEATPVSTNIRKGAKGARVKALQESLLKLGYDVGPDGADGDFGNNTLAAVKKFQEDHGLDNDGIVGKLTQAAIDKALAEKGEVEKPSAEKQEAKTSAKFQTGDTVRFKGGKHYMNAKLDIGFKATPGKAKITLIYGGAGAKHPYHLVRVAGGGSNVYGWVDAADIEAI